MSDPALPHKNTAPIIAVWSRLAGLGRLTFTATPGAASQTGWAGHGEARIDVTTADDGLRLHEQGQFTPTGIDRPVAFANVYRWVHHGQRLSLWHERFGRDAAVWLFDLAPVADNALATIEPHLCGADRYRARLTLAADGFDLCWSISGPRKDETLAYRYRG